eukprot:1140554-Amphidinium_carterae.2
MPAVPEWCTSVKRALFPPRTQLDLRKIYKVVAGDVMGPGHAVPVPLDLDAQLDLDATHQTVAEHICPICAKGFTTNRGLATHKLRQHAVIPPLALRVRGTVCVACGSQLGTRSRLLGHLQDKHACALHVVAQVVPMTVEEYHNSVSSLNSQNDLLTRVLPKTGPIPLSEGRHISQPVQACNPFVDED